MLLHVAKAMGLVELTPDQESETLHMLYDMDVNESHRTFPLRSAFIAIPLEGKAKWLFQALQEELREWEEILSFQNPHSPHLTLQFWPSVMEIEYKQVLEQAKKIAEKAQSFQLNVQGVDTFGSRGEDRVLFLSVPFSDELARLRKLCPWPLDKPFSPHITLARVRHPQRFHIAKKSVLKALGDPDFAMDVSLLRLYAEVEGRKQSPLMDFPFDDESMKHPTNDE